MSKQIVYDFHLIFDAGGGFPRVTKNPPRLARSEVAVRVAATMPEGVFAAVVPQAVMETPGQYAAPLDRPDTRQDSTAAEPRDARDIALRELTRQCEELEAEIDRLRSSPGETWDDEETEDQCGACQAEIYAPVAGDGLEIIYPRHTCGGSE